MFSTNQTHACRIYRNMTLGKKNPQNIFCGNIKVPAVQNKFLK